MNDKVERTLQGEYMNQMKVMTQRITNSKWRQMTKELEKTGLAVCKYKTTDIIRGSNNAWLRMSGNRFRKRASVNRKRCYCQAQQMKWTYYKEGNICIATWRVGLSK